MNMTAVEWFNQQLVDRQNGNGDSRSRDEIFEQAKSMEKEQKRYSEVEVIEAIRLARETELKTGGFDSRPFTGNKYSKEEIINQLKSE